MSPTGARFSRRRPLVQTAFVDGATFAGILLKDSGRSAQKLVVRAQWAVDQWPEGWRNREVLGGAQYRAGDYKGGGAGVAVVAQAARKGGGTVGRQPQNRWSELELLRREVAAGTTEAMKK
jgi:hypothetical protein